MNTYRAMSKPMTAKRIAFGDFVRYEDFIIFFLSVHERPLGS